MKFYKKINGKILQKKKCPKIAIKPHVSNVMQLKYKNWSFIFLELGVKRKSVNEILIHLKYIYPLAPYTLTT